MELLNEFPNRTVSIVFQSFFLLRFGKKIGKENGTTAILSASVPFVDGGQKNINKYPLCSPLLPKYGCERANKLE